MAAPRRPSPAPDGPGADERVVELARRVGGVLAELGLSEIEVDAAGLRVRVLRTPPAPAPAAAGAASASAELEAVPRPVVSDAATPGLVTMEAPMVGTFYRASAPAAAPYVNEGDVVKEGQILCIIEAMKLMNEIESRVAGRVVKILVENAQPVEYGQPLFLIEPQG